MSPVNPALLNLPFLRAAYSDRASWLMARCSQLAYTPFETGKEGELRADLKELGLEFVRGFSRDATCAFLARNDRFAVLSFRGTTKDYRNILTDIDIRFRHDKSGTKIADGFSRAYALVEKEIADAVGALEPDLPLYITGHSLGGALAVIASIHIRPSDRIAACYTYGCPRVGNAEFTENLWKVPVYRQVHSSDIVPRVPFGFGYRQAGDLRYIKPSGKLVEDPNSILLFCSFAWHGIIKWKSLFENHFIAGYLAALEAWAIKRLTKDDQVRSASGSAPRPPIPPGSAAPGPTPPKSLTASGT